MLSVEPFGEGELLERLGQTRLRGFDGARVYENAQLELAQAIAPDALAPAQRYVLKESIERVLELRAALLEALGLDTFTLDGGAYVRTSDDPGERIPVIPPVVEESHEPDGRTVLVVNDGMHRVYAARSLGLPISVVVARGVPSEWPYYALALRNGWADVAQLNELPEGFQKKEYRHPDNYKALFREFNDVFAGVQKERRKTNPAHLRA